MRKLSKLIGVVVFIAIISGGFLWYRAERVSLESSVKPVDLNNYGELVAVNVKSDQITLNQITEFKFSEYVLTLIPKKPKTKPARQTTPLVNDINTTVNSQSETVATNDTLLDSDWFIF